MKMKRMEDSQWDGFSDVNLDKIYLVLGVLVNSLELRTDNKIAKIPFEKFTNSEYVEILDILTFIDGKVNCIQVLNEYHKKLLRESNPSMTGWQEKNQILKDIYFEDGIVEEDLDRFFLIKVTKKGSLSKLKELHNDLNSYMAIKTKSSNKNGLPENWKWFDKKKGQYQFGAVIFSQTGKTRKDVFKALMDTYEKTPQAISTQAVKTISGTGNVRIVSIEINAINKRLKNEVCYYFKGSGKGYYTLEKCIPHK